MRGEDCCQITYVIRTKETPPHAWGRHVEQRKELFTLRNTPTCVGKTKRPQQGINIAPETPPHAWGRPRSRGRVSPESRNTPTCVGKTHRSPATACATEKHPHMRGEDSGE